MAYVSPNRCTWAGALLGAYWYEAYRYVLGNCVSPVCVTVVVTFRWRSGPGKAYWCTRQPAAWAVCSCSWPGSGGYGVGTAGTEEKRDLVRSLGADQAVSYSQPDWVERVKEATGGRGVDVVLDSVNGSIGAERYRCLAPFGKLVLYGALSRETNPISPEQVMQLIFQNQSVTGFSLYSFSPDVIQGALGRLFAYLREGSLKVVARHAFPLVEAAAAHRAIEGRQTTGKVVLLA